MPIFPKCLQMGTGANEHLGEGDALCPFPPNVYKWALGQIDIWVKEVPQVSCAHFPQVFSNEQWRKWALSANGHFGKFSPSVPLPQCPFCPSVFLGEMGTGHLWYPFRPLAVPISHKCPFAPNAYLTFPLLIGENLGEMGTGHLW